MFEVIVNSNELSKALDYLEPAVDDKTGSIYLESTDIGECILYSENKECAISISLICANPTQKGMSDNVDYKVFKKVINSLKDKENLTIHQDDNSNEISILYEMGVKPIKLNTISLPPLTKNPLATTVCPADAPTFNTYSFCCALKSCTDLIDLQSAPSVMDCCDFKVSQYHGIMNVINTKKAIGCSKEVSTATVQSTNKEEFIMNLRPLKKVTSLFSSFKETRLYQDANGICICSGDTKVVGKDGIEKLVNVSEIKVILHKFSSNYPTNVFYNVKYSSSMCMTDLDKFNNSLDRIIALSDNQNKDVLLEADGENITMSIASTHGIIEDKIQLKLGTNTPFKGLFEVNTLKSVANANKPFEDTPFSQQLYIAPSNKSDSIFVIGSDTAQKSCSFITSKAMATQTQLDTVEETSEEEKQEESAEE